MENFDCLDFENVENVAIVKFKDPKVCLLYTSPSPRDRG